MASAWDYWVPKDYISEYANNSGLIGLLGGSYLYDPSTSTLTYKTSGTPVSFNGQDYNQTLSGFLDPRLNAAITDQHNDSVSNFLQSLYAKDPVQAAGVLGDSNYRYLHPSGSGDPVAFDPVNYWPHIFGSEYYRSTAEPLGLRTPDALAKEQWMLNYMSPSAQSARDDPDDGFLGLGDLGTLLAIAGLAYGGYSLISGLGSAGTAAGATTGLGSSTAAAGLGTGTAATGLGLGTSAVGMPLFTAAELASIFPGLTAAELGTLGASLGGAAAASTGAGGSMFDFGDLPSWMFEPATEAASGLDPLGELINAQAAKYGEATAFDWLSQYVTDNPLSSARTGSSLLGNLLGTGSGLLGSYLQGSAAKDAATANALAQVEAAKIAADAAKFKPVGVTSRFGTSNFGYDANGNLTSAGYSLSPDMKAQQDRLFGAMSPALDQYLAAQSASAPMGAAGQRAMELGQGYLSTTPQEQAQKYMAEQQALLAASRERELSNLRNKLAQEGRLGLATGATQSGMMASNPELEAYYNALMQQDLGLAAKATQGGMDYAKFGAGMVGTGGDLLNAMYGTQTAAYAPYQTALGGVSGLEGLGQQAMDLGVNIGAKGTAGTAQAGLLTSQGMQNAANIMQQSNAYSPWGSLLSGAGQALQSYNQPQQYRFDPYTGQQVRWN